MNLPVRVVIWILLSLLPLVGGAAYLGLHLDRMFYGPVEMQLLEGSLHPGHWSLSVSRLLFTTPPWQVNSLMLNCRYDNPSTLFLRCPGGRLSGRLPRLDGSVNGLFRYDFTQDGSKTLDIDPLDFNDSRWRLNYVMQGSRWEFRANTKRQAMDIRWLKPLWSKPFEWIKEISGELGMSLLLKGKAQPTGLHLMLDSRKVSLHDADFSRVTEHLRLSLKLEAKHGNQGWLGQLDATMDQGEVLFLPIYLPLRNNPLQLNSRFVWKQGYLKFWNGWFRQLDCYFVDFKGQIDNGIISVLDANYQINLPSAYRLYGFPFLEGSNWEAIDVKTGQARGLLSVRQDAPEQGYLYLDRVTVSDGEHRVGVKQLNAHLQWQGTFKDHLDLFPTSRVSWDAGHIYAIPVGKADLFLRLTGDDIRLLQPAHIPILDGKLLLDRFELLDAVSTPKIQLAGKIQAISLELLTRVLGFPPLAGTLSGDIPGVRHAHYTPTLQLDGKITVKVFDGTVTIENLVITDLFGVLPRLQSDISFHGLDLELITHHFSFGRITGRVEGYIKSLYLENWRPVSFDAWIGTPTNDTSKHRISQQAIENLTDLGGGGATGLLSRTFLRFFEEFNYDRIGLGLKLANNVCTLRGVAPAPNGYYIVTGAGLPRIDVIGYNRRIDWPTLLKRLARITQIQTPVVQ